MSDAKGKCLVQREPVWCKGKLSGAKGKCLVQSKSGPLMIESVQLYQLFSIKQSCNIKRSFSMQISITI